MDPRIRIRIHPKMSWIRNTVYNPEKREYLKISLVHVELSGGLIDDIRELVGDVTLEHLLHLLQLAQVLAHATHLLIQFLKGIGSRDEFFFKGL